MLPIQAAVFSADGNFVVSGSQDSTAILWHLSSGRQLARFASVDGAEIVSIAVSADGRYVATGSKLGAVAVWDTATNKRRRLLVWHNGRITSLAFRKNGAELFSASVDRSAVLWEIATGLKLQLLNTLSPIIGGAISPNESQAATVQDDGTAVLWDLGSGKRIQTLQGNPAPKIVVEGEETASEEPPPGNYVAFSPDGKRLATARADNSVIIWSAEAGAKLRTLAAHKDLVNCIAFSGDGKEIVTASHEHHATDWVDVKAIVWDADSGKQIRTANLGSRLPVGISSDGARIVAASWSYGPGEQLGWWLVDTARDKVAQQLRPIIGPSPAAISRDGRQIAIFAKSQKAVVFHEPDADPITRDVAEPPHVVVFQFGNAGAKAVRLPSGDAWLETARFSPDGNCLATSDSKSAAIWNMASGQRTHTYGRDAAFSADSRQVISHGSFNPDINHSLEGMQLWDLASDKHLQYFPGQGAAAFSDDGRQVAIGGKGVVKIYDRTTGKQIRALDQENFEPYDALLFSPDGKLLAATGSARKVVLWEIQSGKRLDEFDGGGGMAFTPDGTKLAISDGTTTNVWSVATRKKTLELSGDGSRFVMITPDGRFIATGNWNKPLVFYGLATGKRVLSLVTLDAGEDWFAVTPDGRFDGTEKARQIVGVRVGSGMNVVPVGEGAKKFYRPGLVDAILSGDLPKPESK